MASIFKAVDQLNGHTVAIKIPYAQFESDVVFYGRFQREEEVVRRLDHANIIKVFTPERKSRMYIAMEFVEGISLRVELRDKRPFTTDHALDYARQICGALVYMHGQHVVHRDLPATARGNVHHAAERRHDHRGRAAAIEVQRVRRAELGQERGRLLGDVQTEQLLDLACENDHRDAAGEAHRHWIGNIFYVCAPAHEAQQFAG